MKIKTVYLINNNSFGNTITEWSEGKLIDVVSIDQKSSDLVDIVDGAVVFHENHNFTKEDEDIQEFLESNNRPSHRVDINGTLAATKSNFTMWLERNKPSNLLILGSLDIAKNPNLKRFLDSLQD
ncbi:MAG: hypothetical protein COA32_09290 [Fluviicola sp.]|nr:MAG: hypothetical protein COA32_09290 [Fluviicola sp.]